MYQERNNNKFLQEELGIIRKLAGSHLSIMDAGIQLSYLKRLYFSQSGMFYIPFMDTDHLHRLHGLITGVPCRNEPLFKCEPIPVQLFTNCFGRPPDWVLSQKGDSGPVVIESWPAETTVMDKKKDLLPTRRSAPDYPFRRGVCSQSM
jgi:hypothetical protein